LGGHSGAIEARVVANGGLNALPGVDFELPTASLTFAEGVTEQSFVVRVLDDATYEASKFFVLGLVADNLTFTGEHGDVDLPADAVIGSVGGVTVGILDNGDAGVVQFAAVEHRVVEDAGTASIVVVRSDGASGNVSVQFQLTEVTARTGVDFVLGAGTLHFADNVTAAMLEIAIVNDAEFEAAELLLVRLSAPAGGVALGDTTTLVVWIDDDGDAGTIAFLDAALQVSEDSGNATVAVRREGGTDGHVSAQLSVIAESASLASDFDGSSARIAFGPGETQKEITVFVHNDMEHEPDETVRFVLSEPLGGASIGASSSLRLTIVDDRYAKVLLAPAQLARLPSAATRFGTPPHARDFPRTTGAYCSALATTPEALRCAASSAAGCRSLS